jgi:DNA polymerase-3 subunit alpha
MSRRPGLVKFDFLGLKTLSVLKEGQRLLAEQGVEVDFDRCLGRCGGLRAAPARRHGRRVPAGIGRHAAHAAAVRPSSFGDIIALVSLYRPGPMDNIPLFGDRKNGRVPIDYPHPLLEEVLKETYGIFVYQEQVMQAAQVLAGYSLGEADLLRRAMGKKIQSEMDASARASSRAARRTISPRQGQRTVRLDRQVRRLRFQQEPRRGLCAGRLSHRLAEGASPGRVLRSVDELRHGAD